MKFFVTHLSSLTFALNIKYRSREGDCTLPPPFGSKKGLPFSSKKTGAILSLWPSPMCPVKGGNFQAYNVIVKIAREIKRFQQNYVMKRDTSVMSKILI